MHEETEMYALTLYVTPIVVLNGHAVRFDSAQGMFETRLAGVLTPSMFSPAGNAAFKRTLRLLTDAKSIAMRTVTYEPQWVTVEVWCDKTALNETLVKEGLARPYGLESVPPALAQAIWRAERHAMQDRAGMHGGHFATWDKTEPTEGLVHPPQRPLPKELCTPYKPRGRMRGDRKSVV